MADGGLDGHADFEPGEVVVAAQHGRLSEPDLLEAHEDDVEVDGDIAVVDVEADGEPGFVGATNPCGVEALEDHPAGPGGEAVV
ncbi:MAG: hypothetical protein CO108_02950 [Deltaproteobacteria bacterium CG_4_9_14_3_um_filter_63_12]|nr:MAG: hypothetical protein CO108_02950 [Deltaproteobacteria bacterium CG_4_9_14_3_um_filter_63_12]